MKKFLICTLIVLLPSCVSSKKALKETRMDLVLLAEALQKNAESDAILSDAVTEYVEMPVPVKMELKQNASNRISESKAIKKHVEDNSKKDVGIFGDKNFGQILSGFFEVVKPHFEKVIKAVAEAAKDQGGVVGMIGSGLLLAYGVYQHVTKNKIVTKVKEEKAEEKEIEYEADKIIPAEDHERWDSAVKIAKVKVLSKKKGIS